MYLGEKVKSAVEIQEVAKDVVERVEARRGIMKKVGDQALVTGQ